MNRAILNLSWSTSRGRDTYGWNICRLEDSSTGKRYRTCGGGYDMVGTVLGEWLVDNFQVYLQEIGDRAGSYYSKANGYQSHRIADGGAMPFGRPDPAYLYGMTRNDDTGRITIDGACGTSTVRDIAAAIGLDLVWFGDRKGRTLGYFVAPLAKAAA